MLLLGPGNGYVPLCSSSGTKRDVKNLPGRIMSLLMLSSAGLVPAIQTISGDNFSHSLNKGMVNQNEKVRI